MYLWDLKILREFFYAKPSSKDVVNKRLKLILMHDRDDTSPEFLEVIKSEILENQSEISIINQYLILTS